MRSARRGALLGGALIVSAVCGGLGIWQSLRYVEAGEWMRESAARMREPVLPLEDALRDPAAAEWRRIVAAGRLELERTVLLLHQTRERPDGRSLESGVKAITPLRTAQGALLLVDRGFVADTEAEALLASNLDEDVADARVVGVLRPLALRPLPDVPVAPRRRWHRIDLAGLQAQLGEPLLPWLLVRVEPSVGAGPQAIAPRPTPRVDHLNYAITWFSIASVALVGGVAVAWRRRRSGPRLRTGDRPSNTPPGGVRT